MNVLLFAVGIIAAGLFFFGLGVGYALSADQKGRVNWAQCWTQDRVLGVAFEAVLIIGIIAWASHGEAAMAAGVSLMAALLGGYLIYPISYFVWVRIERELGPYLPEIQEVSGAWDRVRSGFRAVKAKRLPPNSARVVSLIGFKN